jgi:TonB family protein
MLDVYSTVQTPAQKRLRIGVYTATAIVHLVVLTAVIRAPQPIALGTGTSAGPQPGLTVVLPGPVRPTGTAGVTKPAVRRIPSTNAIAAPAPQRPPEVPGSSMGSGGGGQAAAGGAAAGAAASGPVRLGSNLGLIKKVNPVYPPSMEMSKAQGTVILDAVIHRDGTVGDVTVLKSSGAAFERAAIDAVQQWRYTPLPYEGVVTVTINFTLPR